VEVLCDININTTIKWISSQKRILPQGAVVLAVVIQKNVAAVIVLGAVAAKAVAINLQHLDDAVSNSTT